MGNPYTSVTVANYNSNPPSDDGSQTPANRVQWSTHKTKIGDPLKTAIEAVNTNVNAAMAKVIGGAGVISTAISYAVTASDQGKLVKITAAGTITTPDATVVGSPFVFSLLNLHSSAITLDGSGSQLVNGSASLSVAPGDGYQIYTDGTNWFAIGRKTGVLPRGYIDGCTLSNGDGAGAGDQTNDITISAGVCRDSTNAVDITVAAMTKQLDANWSAGTAAGMRNSAAGIADTTYHIYAVAKADGTQDIYAHTSATVATVLTALQAETGGADYVYARRIRSIFRKSAAIVKDIQHGDKVIYTTPPGLSYNNSPGTLDAFTITLDVPLGVQVDAHMHILADVNTVYLSDLNAADLVPSRTASPLATYRSSSTQDISTQVTVRTSTSGTIRGRVLDSGTAPVRIAVIGYTDLRGKDA